MRDMTTNDTQMKLRLPAAVRDRIAEVAKANGRSMNAEIVVRLEQSFDNNNEDGQSPLALLTKQVTGLIDENIKMRQLLTETLRFIGKQDKE